MPGVPYPIFRAALDRGDLSAVRSYARAIGTVRLDDALRICLLMRDGNPVAYERAAVRWLGRFALEARGATIDDLRLAADALDALPREPVAAMERLQRICIVRGLA
ncbi:MAG: hypothetical protein ACYCXW_12875 [Solirubrobacteraceae bacterium]